jgi:hypothetical protein
MSMGLRIGGSHVSPNKPPAWQLNLFAVLVFLPLALGFVACGWCLVFAKAISRPDRKCK